jgi:hypothetical protein
LTYVTPKKDSFILYLSRVYFLFVLVSLERNNTVEKRRGRQEKEEEE